MLLLLKIWVTLETNVCCPGSPPPPSPRRCPAIVAPFPAVGIPPLLPPKAPTVTPKFAQLNTDCAEPALPPPGVLPPPPPVAFNPKNSESPPSVPGVLVKSSATDSPPPPAAHILISSSAISSGTISDP